jgi:hypothetical protein
MLQKIWGREGGGKRHYTAAFWNLTQFFFPPPFLSKLLKEAIKQAGRQERKKERKIVVFGGLSVPLFSNKRRHGDTEYEVSLN